MTKQELIGKAIDDYSKEMVTSEVYWILKKRYTDSYIIDCLWHCSKGNRLALLDCIDKRYYEPRVEAIEREELQDKDIFQKDE